MTIIFAAFALTTFIGFVIKFFMHAYLDSQNGFDVKFSPFLAIEYVLLYDKDVEPEFQNLKKLCNSILKITISFFCLTLISLILKNIIDRP